MRSRRVAELSCSWRKTCAANASNPRLNVAHRPPHPARLRWAVENQRDPVTTFFDAAGKPAAVLVGNAKRASNDLRSVLYARDVPGLSTINLNDMVAGQVFRTVDAKKTMEDGTVMHAVGIIRRVYTGDGAPLGLYRVDPEAGQFKTGVAEMQFAGQWNITDIVNGKKETIAYTDPLLRDGAVGKGSRQGEGRRAEQVGAQPDDAAAAGLVLVLIHFYRLLPQARGLRSYKRHFVLTGAWFTKSRDSA